jgi:hypothetical protein
LTKDQKFFNVLQDIFIAHKMEGKDRFINLMGIKSKMSGFYGNQRWFPFAYEVFREIPLRGHPMVRVIKDF